MSKSIYEEALEGVNYFIEDIEETTKLFIHQTKTAIEKAQKQEKLLELYKKLATVRDDMLDYSEIVNHECYYEIRGMETDLKEEIKELENEIEA